MLPNAVAVIPLMCGKNHQLVCWKKKIGYAIGLDKWGWMLGTGMYIDNVTARVAGLKSGIAEKTRQTFFLIMAIAVISLALVGGTGVALTLQQYRASQSQLKALNQAIIDTQEHERARIARELHDGISQQLSSTKYVFELARIQQSQGKKTTDKTLSRGLDSLTGAISEIRRISKDLRPGLLDDLGLAPAIKALAQEFSERTGIKVTVAAPRVRELLQDDAKTALFRIAQEALNNVARHSRASKVKIILKTNIQQVRLTITDNGIGFGADKSASIATAQPGMGLKNMAERLAHFGGSFDIETSKKGTTITVQLDSEPKTHNNKIAAE